MTSPERPRARNEFSPASLAGALLGLVIILILRRYPGIYHDAILYVGEGLMRRWPGIYGQDLFFMHGGQDRYSAFPWLLAQTFRWMTPPAAAMWGALLGQLLFASASWYCLRALLPERQRYWAWLAILCLPAMYGVIHIFSYDEPFLTPRPFAEAACLLAIGSLARGRSAWAIACLALASLLHPLQTIAALLVIWPWAVIRDRRWLHAAWLAIPAICLGFTRIAPFDGMFRAADPAWLESLRASTQLFVASWSMADYKFLGFDALVLAWAWRTLKSPFGTWCIAAAIGLLIGFAANLLLVDCLHLVLPAGLQFWRVHWLAHWLSIAAIAVLLYRHLHAREFARALLLALAAHFAWGETDWGWLAMSLLYLGWPRIIAGPRARLARPLTWLFALCLFLLFVNLAANELKWFRLSGYRLDLYPIDRRLVHFPAIALGLPLLGVYAWSRVGRRGQRILLGCVLLPLLALGTWLWDARPALARTIEHAAYREDAFGAIVPEHAQVYWDPDSSLPTWLVLRRANYFSMAQLAGQMYSRATTMEGRARERRMDALDRDTIRCRNNKLPPDQRANCHVGNESLRQACGPGPTMPPDYIVLPFPQTQRPAGHWTVVDPRLRDPVVTYRLYKCSDVMLDLEKAKRP